MLAKLGHKQTVSNPAVEKKTPNNPDICQDSYIYDKLSGDYPYFYKGEYL